MGKSADIYRAAFLSGLALEAPLTVTAWADLYRFLPPDASAEPGRYESSRTPYFIEVMNCLSKESPIQLVVVVAGAQLGKSETLNNWIGYEMDAGSGSIMVVQPTLDLAKEYSKQRLASMISATPRLSGKVCEAKSRDAGNAVLAKKFPGGWLFIGGANSAPSLCSKPVGKVGLDEVDRFPVDVGNEGDPVELAMARARTFRRRKIYMSSTPTIDGRSRIQRAYLNSDQRRYHVPCPHCGVKQVFRFERLDFSPQEPRKAVYRCEACERAIEERHKTQMLEGGEWIAENPGAGAGLVAGFHISSLYSPWQTWGEIAELYLKAKENPTELKSFTNTVLGEVWKEKGEAPEWEKLYARREKFPLRKVPRRAVLLTAGADVQKDRIEVGVYAWGPGKERWAMDKRIIMGDTSTEAPYKELDELVHEQFEHECGALLPVRLLAIDSGFNTQSVYNWVRRHSPNRVIAVKGREDLAVMIAPPTAVDVDRRGKKARRGGKVWTIGVGIIKSEFYAWLRLETPAEGEPFPAGYCHFPEDFDEEFFKQLTAEQLVPRVIRGYRRYVWEKTRERNEALDIATYARAAAARVGIDRFKPETWMALASDIGADIAQSRIITAPQRNTPAPPDKSSGGSPDNTSLTKRHEAKSVDEKPRKKRSFL